MPRRRPYIRSRPAGEEHRMDPTIRVLMAHLGDVEESREERRRRERCATPGAKSW
ncbi:MAG: hypothetical protein M5R36_12995 [Deltaproteobacteria bacterium]|nr:hypothetical protein [Deltaproteobacteria bacterium]